MVPSIGLGIGEMSPQKQERLEKAAHQFEGMFLGELLKPLSQNDEEDSETGSALMSFGTEAVAGAMAAHGGLGFADRILRAIGESEKLPTALKSDGEPSISR